MKKLILAIALFLLCGCATYQPPKYVLGVYVNPKYNYKIETPAGWDRHLKTPPWLNARIDRKLPMSDLVLSNGSDDGAIYVYNRKSIFNFKTLFTENELVETINEVAEDLKKKVQSKQVCADYHFEKVSSEVLESPNLIYNCQFMCGTKEKGIVMAGKEYWYTCERDDTCMITFLLISTIDDFSKNKEDLEYISNSIVSLKGPDIR